MTAMTKTKPVRRRSNLGLMALEPRWMFDGAAVVDAAHAAADAPEWLADWRLTRGHDLVMEGAASMAEIAASLGYAHLSTFTAAFTKRFGVPPPRLAGQRGQEREGRIHRVASPWVSDGKTGKTRCSL
jgi:AraC-like DNA-binding protein